MKFEPLRYQALAIQSMIEQPCMGLFLDPGLGKTAITLTTFNHLRENFDVGRLLVVAPKAVALHTWPAEVAKWSHLRHLRVGVVMGHKAQEVLESDLDVYVTSVDTVRWLATQPDSLRFPDMLVLDESTKFKNVGSRRHVSLRAILDRFSRRYILTGTPTPNGLIDLFGQMYCVDRGETFGHSVNQFKKTYFVPVEASAPDDQGRVRYKWVPRDDAQNSIYSKLGPLVLRLEGDDLDLPPLIVRDIPIELPRKARDVYAKLRKDLIATLESGSEIVAMNAGALTSKCRQIANGRIFLRDMPGAPPVVPDGVADGGDPFAIVHDEKVHAIRALVDELGGKRILFSYEFRHDVAAIRRALGQSAPVLKSTNMPLADAWNRGEVQYMIAHPRSCGHGLNLQKGGNVLVMIAPPWDLELYLQMYKRLHRQGQLADHVLLYRLVARGTVDETAARALRDKNATQQHLLDALRESMR